MILLQGRVTKDLVKISPPAAGIKEKTEFFVTPPQYRITIFSSPACWQAGRFANSVFSLASKMIKWVKYLTPMQQAIKEPNLAKFLRFGLYLTALVPLIIWKDFISPFHFGKVIVFRTLIEILGAGYLILILKDRSYLPKIDKIFWALFLFVLAFSLTTLTSVLRYPSFWGSLERMGGLWTFWHYFLFFIILTSVFAKKEHWRRLFDLTIFVGVLSAFYGFGQKTDIAFFVGSGGRERVFGTIGNPALFAGYELLSVFLSLIMYFNPKNTQNRRTLYLFAFIITSIAALITAVRGSVLGYAVGLIVFVFLWMRYKKSRFGKIMFRFFVGLAFLFVIFSLLFRDSSIVKNSRYLNRITDLSFNSITVQTRFWAWQAGLKGWSEGPKTILLGWGPENFNIPFSKYFNPKFFVGSGSETLFDRAHNMFVEVLVTMGIVGFLAYINIFIAMFASLRKLLKNNDSVVYGAGLISATIAYMIHNSFIFDTSANFVVFFTIVGFVSYLSTAEDKGSTEFPRSGNPTPRTLEDKGRTLNPYRSLINSVAMVLVVLVAVLIYKTNILPAKANYATTRAIIAGWAGDFNSALAKYKEALSYNVPGKYEYRHRFAQYLIGEGGPSVKEKPVQDAYGYALTEIDKNIKENPVDYLPYLYASRLNIFLGKNSPKSPYNDRALAYSMKALELSPTFIRTYYEIAQAYLNKEDHVKAIEFFQKAVNLNPKTGLSRWYLGAAKVEIGDMSGVKDMEKAMENGYRPSEQDYLRLINIYLNNKDFARIADTYEKIIGRNPKNPQYYASLATAYANLGRIDDAVAMARKAVQVDPSFESDARAFLKSLGREL